MKLYQANQNHLYLNFLITIANADGNIDPSEIKILKKIYELFGKEGNQIFSDIHSFQTNSDNPVTIIQAKPLSTGFAIPKKKTPEQKEQVSLNMDLVAKTLQQTHQVQSLLSDIFTDKNEPNSIPTNQSVNTTLIAKLDASHSTLLNKILSLDSISADEFQNFCTQLSILPGGAIETINNVYFDKVNELYIEENDDILILNKEIAKEIMV